MDRVDFRIVAIAAAAVALLTMLSAWRTRRHVIRRVNAVTSRLERVGTVDVVGGGRLEVALAALEKAAGTGVLFVTEAEAAVDRFRETLEQLHQGVIVCDENGDVAHRNRRADELLADAGHARGSANSVVRLLLGGALRGASGAESVEVTGPPSRALTITAVPLANSAKAVGAAVVVEDISEQRRLATIRRDFVANAAHELQLPVAGLTTLAETLATESDRAVAKKLAERLHIQAAGVGRLLEDLVDLSRVEAEEAPVRESVAVHLILGEAAASVRGLAAERDVTVVVQEPPRRVLVIGDRRQLASALARLIENAVRFSAPGAEVRVHARTTGRTVELTVADRGTGIASTELDRIFERFYRVEPTVLGSGPGLGLSVARHVAASHGGEVRVQSELGQGSTFTLQLPAGSGPVAVTADDDEDDDDEMAAGGGRQATA